MSRVETASTAAKWRAAPPGHLKWAEFDGDHVVYHRPSGKTHVLNSVSAALIKSVLLSPRDAAAAATELAALQSQSSDERFASEVAGLLRRLEELGLVECL